MCELIIAVGAPGAGKNYMYDQFFAKTHVEVSADHFFMRDGQYCFDGNKIRQAHAACKKSCIKAMEKRQNVYVSNTSTKHWERKEYLELADQYKYFITVIVFPDRGFKNIHGVPDDKVVAMQERIDLAPGIYTWHRDRGYLLLHTFNNYFMKVMK